MRDRDHAYLFARAEPQTLPCGTCQGSGEIIEFPADEDERFVACSHCGGTGERVGS